MEAKLFDCSSHEFYGILRVENKSAEDVQNKIQEIKEMFYGYIWDDWLIEDVLNEFPDDWKWEYTSTSALDEIVI